MVAVVNDTVGTMMTCGYEDPHCEVGLIVGKDATLPSWGCVALGGWEAGVEQDWWPLIDRHRKQRLLHGRDA